MSSSPSSPAERRYKLFLKMVHVGAVATALLIATLIFKLPDFVDGFSIGLLLVAIGTILRRKLRDDYVQDLWQAGTAAAFIAIAVCFLMAPLVFFLIAAALGSDTEWRELGIPYQWTVVVALTGFYAGFYWRMLSGGRA
jgi:hypothetical protein